MNCIKRIYCRGFQRILQAAIPFLPYRSPKTLDNVTQIPEVLKHRGINRVLIVTDGHLHLRGMLEPMKKSLSENGVSFFVFDDTIPNPTVLNVELAREVYLKNRCQALIGFGGGSAIDCAKAVGARIARPRLEIPRMKGILKIWLPIPYLIAVPTTAGTGSETTLSTVITDHRTDHKFPINDFPLIPKVAVLDPENTRTLPPHLTATTGMDALTHAIEAYIGNSTTRDTRTDSLEAVSLIAANLEGAYRDGNDMTARANMLRAAYVAGRAFSKSYVGYCHAVAHSLGGKYHIPHGLANAVLLPHVLEAYGHCIDRKAEQLAAAMGIPNPCTETLIAKIRQMNATLGIPATLPGILAADIPQLAAHAAKEANPLYPVPRLMDAKELEHFYYAVMEEPK